MRQKIAAMGVCIAVLVAVIPIYAHHPFSAEYDSNKPVTLNGTVTKFDWANPHSQIYMNVNGDNGKTMPWILELGSVQKLQKEGWMKDSVKMGDQITIEGWQARNKSHHANVNTVTLADGKKLAAGSSYFEGRNEKRTEN